MTTSKATTTLRVPSDLRDEIARLAENRGTTMLEVVAEAVNRLGRDEWWHSVRNALDDRTPEEADLYRAEGKALEPSSADGRSQLSYQRNTR